MNQTIPILSLIIAALAVLVGPLVQWLIARKTLAAQREMAENTLAAQSRLAEKTLVAPMRQNWINELRKKLSKLLGGSSFLMVKGWDLQQDAKDIRELMDTQIEIQLTLNPREDDHKILIETTRMMMDAGLEAEDKERFRQLRDEVITLSQAILKKEWNRVKD